jgi:tryptophan synthase alpha chain
MRDAPIVGPRDTISAAIQAAARQGRPALVGFLTAGFPTKQGFKDNLAAVASVCDVVEIGVPFSDPMADGATVQRASFVALTNGVTLPWIFEELESLEGSETPILLMSYLNPLLKLGLDALPRAAAAAGVAGFIVPDLPFEESGDLKRALDLEGLALVQMVTPVTPPDRLAMLCRGAQGFVYAVTLTGTTGTPKAPSAEVPLDVLEYMDRVKRCASIPVCAGFGIRSREQIARFAGHVDGVVVGSALVEVLERGEDVRAFLRSLREAA